MCKKKKIKKILNKGQRPKNAIGSKGGLKMAS